MCGIVGYVGKRPAAPVLIEGLKRLEYRGYDSAGLAVLNTTIHYKKKAGRLSDWQPDPEHLAGNIGIAHTRWATHGAPTDENAHPHFDCTGKLAIVHNGIIENYQELHSELTASGHKFSSQTDSEVVAHLIESCLESDLLEAVKKALRRVVGSYALVVLSVDHPEFIIAARKDSPLIIGIAQNETFIASDIPAILNHTRDCIILQDDEIARIGQNGAEVFKLQEPNEVSKEIIRIEWDPVTAEKGGYAHFMEKEIYEQPKVLAVACQMAFRQLRRQEAIKGLSFSKPFPGDLMKSVAQIYMVACGTAYHAALLGREYFHRFVGLPVQTEMASEFRYHDYSLTPNTLCVFVSQSGETADTLAALREAKKSGAICLAVVNVVGSSIAREADFVLYTNAGPEIAVASTKAYVSQLVCLLILAHHLGEIVNNKKADLGWPDVLNNLSVLAGEVLEKSQDFISGLSTIWAQAEDAYFIGRGLDYPLAMEGQLKLKEISYVHAESLPAGELKHGTLALITSGTPVIALATQPHLYSKMLSNIREVGARGADIFGITIEGNDGLLEVCHRVFFLPQCDPLIAPVLAAIPLQLLAYEMAKVRGCDIDKPRNLAKSVTVE